MSLLNKINVAIHDQFTRTADEAEHILVTAKQTNVLKIDDAAFQTVLTLVRQSIESTFIKTNVTFSRQFESILDALEKKK